jgi:hypothetical protein
MLRRLLALAAASVGAHGADDMRASWDLRLELGLERPPQRVHEDFANGGSASLTNTTLETPIDAAPARILRVIAAADEGRVGGGLAWGFGAEFVDDRFTIADGTGRGGPELRERLLGFFGMLGWSIAPVPRLELEAVAYGGIGLARISWVSPDIASGIAEGRGDGGYTEEGLRLAAGTPIPHGLLQVFAGIAATQSGAEIDYASGDSSNLRLDAAGWTTGLAAGYRF